MLYKRLNFIIYKHFDNKKDFADFIGVHKQNVYDWTSEKKQIYPHVSVLEKISEKLNVSIDWLITGKHFDNTSNIIEKYNSLNDNNENQVTIPFFPEVFASAGNSNIVHSENKLEIKIEQDLLKNIWINSFDNLSFIKVKGDSMEPLIKEEDILICRKDKNPIKNGKLYVVRVDDKLFVKEVHLDLKNNIVSLVSKNTAYSPIVVNLNTETSFSIRAIVLGSISFNQFKL